MAPFDSNELFSGATRNMRLYVKRVFISDQFDGEMVSERQGEWGREKGEGEGRGNARMLWWSDGHTRALEFAQRECRCFSPST